MSKLRLLITITAMGCWMVLPVGAPIAAEPAETLGAQAVSPEITNFVYVTQPSQLTSSRVAIGGAPSAYGIEWLQSEGFGFIVDLRGPSEEGVSIANSRFATESAGLTYVSLPFDASDPDPSLIASLVDTLGSAKDTGIYLHCRSGVRAAAIWMAVRITNEGWDASAARSELGGLTAKPEIAAELAGKMIALYSDY